MGKKYNFQNMRIFDCCIWVQPSGICKKQFKDDVCKGIFLGYVPYTDLLILYYDCESEHVKITLHCKFDEGFNDVPTESIPLGFQQLIQASQDLHLPQNSSKIASTDLYFFVYPFANK